MPTPADLSDAPKHTIKTVCAQTGILPVTLRAWERRYKLLKPQRTSGNYRLYSDRDIAVLRLTGIVHRWRRSHAAMASSKVSNASPASM